MNETVQHQAKYSKAWEETKSIEGEQFLCGSGEEEILWQVVEGVYEYDMSAHIKKEKQSYDYGDLSFIVGDMPTSFIHCFMLMWPVDFWEDLSRLNDVIVANNVERKTNFQKP